MISTIANMPLEAFSYAELHCRSHYSFLAGASAPAELVDRAHELDYRALALTDIDGVHGMVQGHLAAKSCALPLIAGTELTVRNDLMPTRGSYAAHRIVLLAKDSAGYKNLCRLSTRGRTRCAKGSAWVSWDEVAEQSAGLIALSGGNEGPIDAAWRVRDLHTALAWAERLCDVFGDHAYLELNHHFAPGDDERVSEFLQLADTARISAVFCQNARFAKTQQRRLYDVQCCVREKMSLWNAGQRLAANAHSYLRSLNELATHYRPLTPFIKRSADIAASIEFSFDELSYCFPAFDLAPNTTPFDYLSELTWQGASERYGELSGRHRKQIEHELGLIEKLALAGYFLIVWDIVRFCRERKILCQGRGSAANSAVCYSLGITAVDPIGMELLFERFLSEERDEMPDIDLDIDSNRREEVIQYVYRRFGKERVAMACNINSYHARSAIRDVGKAFGLSLEQVDKAAKAMDRHMPDPSPQGVATRHDYQGVPLPHQHDNAQSAQKELTTRAASLERSQWRALTGLDPDDPTVRQVFEIARAFEGMPRHMGIHSGGVIITQGPTCDVVPVENATMEQRTVVQWDKDDLNAMGIIKIDLLGLGMLGALANALEELKRVRGIILDLAKLPMRDSGVFNMISRGDTVGVFQIESRAQMNMLPRLRPRTFYDLVIEVAIIRPGPIQGEMVHPYLRRRLGLEPVHYEHPALKPVLQRTLGVPLFQEQGMKLAIACAGFTPSEADQLRRAMGHKRSHARMRELQNKLIEGMKENGIRNELAERIYKQLCAFADYGFPESHSASFALIVYASCYLKHHYPEALLVGLLNAQPMGFYSPNTLIADARRHGVVILPPCALRSHWDSTLEEPEATVSSPPGDSQENQNRSARDSPRSKNSAALQVRLGMKSVRGLAAKHREAFECARTESSFTSLIDFARRSGAPRPVLARLATAGAFACFGYGRREALWQVSALPADFGSLPLIDPLYQGDETPHALSDMDESDEMNADFTALGASVRHHPLAVMRPLLKSARFPDAQTLNKRLPNGKRTTIGGMVISRQRPGSAKGMLFITLEDETGLANLVITPPIFSRYRKIARQELFILARGKVEKEGQVVNLLVDHLEPMPMVKSSPKPRSRDFR